MSLGVACILPSFTFAASLSDCQNTYGPYATASYGSCTCVDGYGFGDQAYQVGNSTAVHSQCIPVLYGTPTGTTTTTTTTTVP